jgi:hypothetical protein
MKLLKIPNKSKKKLILYVFFYTFILAQIIEDMTNELTNSQIQDLKNKIKAGAFDIDLEKNNLICLGFEQQTAKELVMDVIRSYKYDLLSKANEKRDYNDRNIIALGLAIVSSISVTVLGDNSVTMIMLSIVLACFAGYYGHPKKAIPAMIGFTIGAIIMPYACQFYFNSRDTTFINIELLIPVFFSFGPALLIKYLLSKIMYSED